MEPLSAVASIIALTQTIEKLFKAAKFAKSIGQIPKEYLELIDDLKINKALGQQVGHHIQRYDASDGEMLRELSMQLNNSVKRLEEISQVIKRSSETSSGCQIERQTKVSTVRWQISQSRIASIRDGIKQTKGNLEICLHLLVSTQVALSVRHTIHMQQTLSTVQEAITRLSITRTEIPTQEAQPPQETRLLQEKQTVMYLTSKSLDNLPESWEFNRYCNPFCHCNCHEMPITRPFAWIESLLGSLIIHTNTSLVLSRQPCNTSACKVRSPSQAKIRYTYPQWYVRRFVEATMCWGALYGPGTTLHLRVPRVIGPKAFQLIRSGDIEMLKQMLLIKALMPTDVSEAGASMMGFILNTRLPLKVRSQIYQMFLRFGFDLGISGPNSLSGVIVARCALRRRAFPVDPRFETALHEAAYGSPHASLKPMRLNEILRAFFTGNDSVLYFVLRTSDKGDLNFRDESGLAVIHYAVRCGRLQALQLLCDKGADFELPSHIGKPIWIATIHGIAPEVLTLLLKKGANPNARGKNNRTPILRTLGPPAKMRMLLDKGADPLVPDSDWQTPFHPWRGPYTTPHGGGATKASIEKSIQILQEKGVDINYQNSKWGGTPIMSATLRCDILVVQVLLRLGARVDIAARDGSTILHMAAYSRDAEIFEILKRADLSDLDPDSRDERGNRAQDLRPDQGRFWRKQYTEREFAFFCDDLRSTRSLKSLSKHASKKEGESDSEEYFDTEG